MASINLEQDVANQRERKLTVASYIAAKSYPLSPSCKNKSLRLSC